jgi:hypothetical protein
VQAKHKIVIKHFSWWSRGHGVRFDHMLVPREALDQTKAGHLRACEFTTSMFESDHKALKATFNTTPIREEVHKPSQAQASKPPKLRAAPGGLADRAQSAVSPPVSRACPASENAHGASAIHDETSVEKAFSLIGRLPHPNASALAA